MPDFEGRDFEVYYSAKAFPKPADVRPSGAHKDYRKTAQIAAAQTAEPASLNLGLPHRHYHKSAGSRLPKLGQTELG